MSLLKHYTASKSDIVHVPQEIFEDTAMVSQVTDVVDITVEELNTVVNLPPEQDPFIVYLEDYVSSLVFIVDKIENIKASEKALRKRIRDALKLLQSLKGHSPAADVVETVEVPVETVVSTASIPGTTNLADFK